MDFGRAGYKQTVKLWADTEEEVTIRWYRAAPGAQVFPEAHGFTRPEWTWDRDYRPELPRLGQPEEWDAGANPLGFLGLHFCGRPEAYLGGGRWGEDAPIYVAPDGTSECCGLPGQGAPGPGQGQEIGGVSDQTGGVRLRETVALEDLVGGPSYLADATEKFRVITSLVIYNLSVSSRTFWIWTGPTYPLTADWGTSQGVVIPGRSMHCLCFPKTLAIDQRLYAWMNLADHSLEATVEWSEYDSEV